MKGRVKDGQTVTVRPVGKTPPKVGDVVLCKVGQKYYLHLVKGFVQRVDFTGDRPSVGYLYQIGNTKGKTNGWTKDIYGMML